MLGIGGRDPREPVGRLPVQPGLQIQHGESHRGVHMTRGERQGALIEPARLRPIEVLVGALGGLKRLLRVRRLSRLGERRGLLDRHLERRPVRKDTPLASGHRHFDRSLPRARPFDGGDRFRGQVQRFGVFGPTAAEPDGRPGQRLGGEEEETCPAVIRDPFRDQLGSRIFEAFPEPEDRRPLLAPEDLLARVHPRVVGLGGQRPALDLDVGAVLVGQRPLVHHSVVALSPGPALLAGKLPVVGGLHDSSVVPGVVGPEEVVDRAVGEDGSRLGIVGEAGHVHPVVLREAVEGGAEVIGGERHRVDEARAVPLREGGVVPEVVGVGEIGRVENADLLVEPRHPRPERQANLPAGPEGLLHLADHQGCRTVLVLNAGDVDGGVAGDGVSLGSPVPLDPARDPGAAKRDQAGADDPVVVEHLLVLALVEDPLDASPDLREAGDLEVLVLEEEGAPGVVRPLRAEVVLHRVGIDDGTVGLAELRVRVVGQERVGRERQFSFPDTNRFLGRRGNRNGKPEQENCGPQGLRLAGEHGGHLTWVGGGYTAWIDSRARLLRRDRLPLAGIVRRRLAKRAMFPFRWRYCDAVNPSPGPGSMDWRRAWHPGR